VVSLRRSSHPSPLSISLGIAVIERLGSISPSRGTYLAILPLLYSESAFGPWANLTSTYIAIITLAGVFFLIAARQALRIPLRIWQIMLGGALVVLITGQIPLVEAAAAIDVRVMVFLLGMFILGEALHASGVLDSFLRHVIPAGLRPGESSSSSSWPQVSSPWC